MQSVHQVKRLLWIIFSEHPLKRKHDHWKESVHCCLKYPSSSNGKVTNTLKISTQSMYCIPDGSMAFVPFSAKHPLWGQDRNVVVIFLLAYWVRWMPAVAQCTHSTICSGVNKCLGQQALSPETLPCYYCTSNPQSRKSSQPGAFHPLIVWQERCCICIHQNTLECVWFWEANFLTDVKRQPVAMQLLSPEHV